MLSDTRSRVLRLLWAASIVAVITTACGSAAEEPPPGARLVQSGPAVSVPLAVAAAASEPAPASPVPATEPPSTPPPATSAPVAMTGSLTPTPAANNKRLTATATFLVTNTLGRGMALRSAPVERSSGRVWPDGTRMVGLGTEQDAYGWTWRWVRDPDGQNGWMPSNYLVQEESAPPVADGYGALLPPSAPPTLIIVPTFATPEPQPTAIPQTAQQAAPALDSSPVAIPTARPIQAGPAAGPRFAVPELQIPVAP